MYKTNIALQSLLLLFWLWTHVSCLSLKKLSCKAFNGSYLTSTDGHNGIVHVNLQIQLAVVVRVASRSFGSCYSFPSFFLLCYSCLFRPSLDPRFHLMKPEFWMVSNLKLQFWSHTVYPVWIPKMEFLDSGFVEFKTI